MYIPYKVLPVHVEKSMYVGKASVRVLQEFSIRYWFTHDRNPEVLSSAVGKLETQTQ
jgi:hypothetical protein